MSYSPPPGSSYYTSGPAPQLSAPGAAWPISGVRGLATAIMVLVGLCGVADLAEMAIALIGLGTAVPRSVLADRLLIPQGFGAVFLLGAGICWIIWQHRLAQGVERSLRRSPGWHIGSWFIPIVSLWFPFQNMKDISSGLDAARPSRASLGGWWAAWIATGFVGNYVTRSTDSPNAGTMAAGSLVGGAVDLVAVVLAILVVRDFTARAEALPPTQPVDQPASWGQPQPGWPPHEGPWPTQPQQQWSQPSTHPGAPPPGGPWPQLPPQPSGPPREPGSTWEPPER